MRLFCRVCSACRSYPARLALSAVSGAVGLSVLSGCALSGGMMTPPAVSAPLSVPYAASRALSPPVSAGSNMPASALPQVWAQQQPLYRQAATACREKRYTEAAALLQRLAVQPGLTEAQTAFVQEQRALCLHDAHLPVPPLRIVSAGRTQTGASASSLLARSAGTTRRAIADADCGPRALLLLCQKEGIAADLPHLRQRAGTTRDGTSLAGLQRAAKVVGLQAEGVQVSREALGEMEMPALAYVNGNHFVAVLSVQGRGEEATATIHDPNSPNEQTISQERLLRLCSGYLLLAHR